MGRGAERADERAGAVAVGFDHSLFKVSVPVIRDLDFHLRQRRQSLAIILREIAGHQPTLDAPDLIAGSPGRAKTAEQRFIVARRLRCRLAVIVNAKRVRCTLYNEPSSIFARDLQSLALI